MRPWLVLLSAVLVTLPAAAQSRSEDEAGDVAEVDKDSRGPLRERVRPVSGHTFLMDGRFEVSPSFTLSVKDAFFTKYMVGLLASYHFAEQFGVRLRASYAFNAVSGSAQICEVGIACVSPTPAQLESGFAFGDIRLLAGADFEWAPLYGKLSLIAERFLQFNMFVAAGPTLVMYGPASTVTVGGTLSAGFRFFVTRWFTVRFEVRDAMYFESFKRPGTTDLSSFRNQIMLDFGASFFFPLDFKEG